MLQFLLLPVLSWKQKPSALESLAPSRGSRGSSAVTAAQNLACLAGDGCRAMVGGVISGVMTGSVIRGVRVAQCLACVCGQQHGRRMSASERESV